MMLQGPLHKMHTRLEQPVAYRLRLGDSSIDLHEQLGKTLRLTWQQQINCVHCGRATNKSFNQGYCYPCFSSLARCDSCILSPEKCHFHLGTCREPDWAKSYCMQSHIIYLSNTSAVKIGITRENQVPTRWIDQGAIQAIPILRVSKRYHAGLVEHAFKRHVSDKTNWRNMLKNQVEEIDLYQIFETLWPHVKVELDAELLDDVEEIAKPDASLNLNYPALAYPQKIVSYNLEKQPLIEGILDAIKGQYLILDRGVINIRKYGGYLVSLESGRR